MRGTKAKKLKKLGILGKQRRWMAMGTLAAYAAAGSGPAILRADQVGTGPGYPLGPDAACGALQNRPRVVGRSNGGISARIRMARDYS